MNCLLTVSQNPDRDRLGHWEDDEESESDKLQLVTLNESNMTRDVTGDPMRLRDLVIPNALTFLFDAHPVTNCKNPTQCLSTRE